MSVAATFSEVFAPELFVLVVTILLTVYELRGGDWSWKDLAGRSTAILVAWTAAFAVYQGGPSIVSGSVPGGEDFFASTGLVLGFTLIWFAWRNWEWGSLMSVYCFLLIATSVVHIVVVPFWDVSSHVVYAAVSAGFLVLVDRRFTVFLLVPAGLVWSRVAIEAHTLAESLGGLVFAVAVVAAAVIADAVPKNADGIYD